MIESYIPILLLLVVSVLNAIMMVVMSHMRVMNPRRPTPQKDMPYESGMIPLGDTRHRFSVKFYLAAIAFIVFDVEVIFLIPWAVAFRDLGAFGFVEIALFVGVLFVGLAYMWKKGALEWD